MATTNWRSELDRPLLTLRIIVIALFAGPLIFLVVAVLFAARNGNVQPAVRSPLAVYVFVGIAVSAIVARVIVPNLTAAKWRRRIADGSWRASGAGEPADEATDEFLARTGDAGMLFYAFQAQTLLAAALVEGSAMLMIVGYMLTRSVVCLALAVLLVLAIALGFPFRSSVEHWIEDQLQLLKQER